MHHNWEGLLEIPQIKWDKRDTKTYYNIKEPNLEIYVNKTTTWVWVLRKLPDLSINTCNQCFTVFLTQYLNLNNFIGKEILKASSCWFDIKISNWKKWKIRNKKKPISFHWLKIENIDLVQTNFWSEQIFAIQFTTSAS